MALTDPLAALRSQIASRHALGKPPPPLVEDVLLALAKHHVGGFQPEDAQLLRDFVSSLQGFFPH